MLFPWARAEVFAKKAGAQLLSPQWVNLSRIGPWLRREKYKRYYFSNFANQGCVQGASRLFVQAISRHFTEAEFQDLPVVSSGVRPVCVDFTGMKDFFLPFFDERDYIKRRLYEIADPRILSVLGEDAASPYIGVHIRRGDFLTGGIAIDNAWYVNAINKALSMTAGGGIPIQVFSDADERDLLFLKKRFPSLRLMPKAPALLDLFLLSKSTVLVATSQSTFSMWAVFLGQMPSIWHPRDLPPVLTSRNDHQPIIL